MFDLMQLDSIMLDFTKECQTVTDKHYVELSNMKSSITLESLDGLMDSCNIIHLDIDSDLESSITGRVRLGEIEKHPNNEYTLRVNYRLGNVGKIHVITHECSHYMFGVGNNDDTYEIVCIIIPYVLGKYLNDLALSTFSLKVLELNRIRLTDFINTANKIVDCMNFILDNMKGY